MIFVDANFLIYLLSNNPKDAPWQVKCRHYLQHLKDNRKRVITSAIVIAEVVAKLSPVDKATYETLIKSIGIDIYPYGMQVARLTEFDRDLRQSANINRKKFKVDNMILAAALAHQCTAIITNDSDFVTLADSRIKVTLIDDIDIADASVQQSLRFGSNFKV